MRQLNGSELFGRDDPRSASIGIIEVAPEDDRQSIITAIVTQEKLQRKQTLLVLPEQGSIFRRASDFEAFLETVKARSTQLIFILPPQSRLARIARQQQFAIFGSLEEYAQSVQEHTDRTTEGTGSDVEKFHNAAPEEVQAGTAASEQADNVLEDAAAHENAIQALAAPPGVKEEVRETTPSTLRERRSPRSSSPGSKMSQPLRPDPAIIQLPTPSLTVATDIDRNETMQQPAPAREAPAPDLAPAHPPSRKSRLLLPIVGILLLVLLLLGSVLSVLSGIGPFGQLLPLTATITITPEQRVLSQRYQFAVVTEGVDPTKQQIQARFLSSTTFTQTQTIRASGVGIIPARFAQGMLTFYNALAQAQTIPAGTVISDGNGIQLSTDQAATIPAATPPNEGATSVAMHALTQGERGNIAALDLNAFACCHAGITVTNMQAFSGGTDQQSYAYIQQSDIDSAAHILQASLARIGEKAVQVQVLPEEQMLAPVHCVPRVAATHSAGERVPSAAITESVQCLAEVYNQQNVQAAAHDLLLAFGQKNLGANYAISGQSSARMLVTTPPNEKGEAALQIVAQGVWNYQVRDTQKIELVRLVAGKNRDTAIAILQRQTGVHSAGIALSRVASAMLPTDQRAITIHIQTLPNPN
ncbi:MAG: hypothetical protein PVSMB5_12640 [Ktedonobacteraceae bacterium]